MVDDKKLHDFIGQMLGDLGGAFSIPLVRIGDTFGLYKALRADGPMTAAELATKTGLAERYLREWLSAQAASNYLNYNPATSEFELSPEQAMVLADEDSPVGSLALLGLRPKTEHVRCSLAAGGRLS